MPEPITAARPGTANVWLLLLPTLVVLGAGTLYPIGFAGVLSVSKWDWGGVFTFVGLQNFQRLLVKDSFRIALLNTLYFSAATVTLELILGLLVALAANRIRYGAGIVRVCLIAPLMVSGIAVSLVWKVLLDPTLGIVNYLLAAVGLPTSNWLGSPAMAMPSLILIDTWWQTGFVFIVLAAALKSLPAEPFEAARLEGASPFQIFRHVTLPMLRPVIVTILVFRTIDTLKVFDLVFGLTGGGPLRRTESVQNLVNQTAFKFHNFGEAAAMVVLFSAFIFGLCLVYLGRSERA